MVPHAIGPDDRDRPAHADLQAIGLGPLHAPAALCCVDKAQLAQPALEEVPRRLARLARAAALLLAHRAKENLALDRLATDPRKSVARQRAVIPGHAMQVGIGGLPVTPSCRRCARSRP